METKITLPQPVARVYPDRSIVLGPREGHLLHVLGSDYIFKVRAGDTHDMLCQFEGFVAPGMGSPPHKVHGEDKTFFVLTGTFSFLVQDRQVALSEGGFVAVPRGVAHSFTNIGTAQGRLLVTFTPAGHHEEMFQELALLPPGPPDLAKVREIALRYDVELL